MTVLKAHYDGKQIVLDEPVPESVAANTTVKVVIESPRDPEEKPTEPSLAQAMKAFIGIGNDLPTDGARNVDHYLYGAPRK